MQPIESPSVQRWLPVLLTTDEKVEFGRKLARLHTDYRQVELEKKAANDAFKERMEAIDSQAGQTAQIIRSGQEDREVECRWRYDFPSNKKELVRMDTGELVETEAITAEERQLLLQLDQEKEAATAAQAETK